MITDQYIKDKITETIHKMSIHRLNEKTVLFQHVDLPFISIKYRKHNKLITVSKKRLRFYLDLIETWYPLYSKSDNITKADFISEVFKCWCTEEDLDSVALFKKITKKKVITMKDNNVKTIKRLRWRGKHNLSKNYIHVR
jgi:hypothetical protein